MSTQNTRETVTEYLHSLRQDNYRRARWHAIDAARRLDPPMTWPEIGECLGVKNTAAARFYAQDRDLAQN